MDLVERYRKDVERLKEALLASPVGERVIKIYLFGSVARGTVTEQSDIDVLIVLKNGADAAEQIADVLLSLQMEGCGPLGPLTCSVEDLIAPKDYFLYTVTRRGKEIYSMPEEEIRREGARRLRDLVQVVMKNYPKWVDGDPAYGYI
ncbi:MAG: nucleotidyltransferase domain-containing protein, partial [candidate division NC10 bacterium]|nr:nucleotidyltransferase domain-containing protein [candidate division NC10 bacterium]